MPTPAESLWSAAKGSRYSEIKLIIESNPEEDLVNSQNPATGRPLIIWLLSATTGKGEAKPRELIEYLLKHPKMDWGYKHPKINQTMITAILLAAQCDKDLSIIESIIDMPQLLVDGAKLTYELATEHLVKQNKFYQLCIQKGESQEVLASKLLDIKNAEVIVSLVRDITILGAKSTDNVAIMERLSQAGGNPMKPLSTGGRPLASLGDGNPSLLAWKRERAAKSADRLEQSSLKLSAKIENHENHEKLIAKVGQIHSFFAGKENEIHHNRAVEFEARVANAINKAK